MFRKQNYDMPINAINILDSIFGVNEQKKTQFSALIVLN